TVGRAPGRGVLLLAPGAPRRERDRQGECGCDCPGLHVASGSSSSSSAASSSSASVGTVPGGGVMPTAWLQSMSSSTPSAAFSRRSRLRASLASCFALRCNSLERLLERNRDIVVNPFRGPHEPRDRRERGMYQGDYHESQPR